MKPIVVEKNKNGKVELTVEELQKMLDEAYQEGLSQSKTEYVPVYTNRGWLTSPSYYWDNVKYEITC